MSVLLVSRRSRASTELSDLLDRDEGIKLATCTDGVVAAVAEAKPNVIVLDIKGTHGTGFATARVIRRNHAHCPMMFIGADGDEETIREALDLGAMAYLTEAEPPRAIVTAIGEVAAGRAVFSAQACRRLGVVRNAPARVESTEQRKNLLTAREIEIVRYIAQGLADKEIAKVANISTKTVEAHCAHIRNKLAVRGRVDIARFAFREGLAKA